MARLSAVLRSAVGAAGVQRSLARDPAAGRARAGVDVWCSDDDRVALRVERDDWERRPWLGGDAHRRAGRRARRRRRDAVRSATLASALRAAGEPVGADAPAAEQIAAAYRAFGAEGLLKLNGDFAFVL